MVELYPQIPICMHQDHGNSEVHLRHRHPVRLHQRDDGRQPEGRRQDPRRLRLQRRASRKQTVTNMAHCLSACQSRASWACSAALETGMGDEGGRPRLRGQARPQPAFDRSRPGGGLRQAPPSVDALAIAMGTSHGAYKFSRKPDGDVLAMGVIEEIHRRLPDTHLVMHGSSSACRRTCRTLINQLRRPDAPDLGRAG